MGTHENLNIVPKFIGISGGTGSGKTTIAKTLVKQLGESAALFEMDCYYKDVSHLSKEEILAYNFDHPDAMDFALMKEHLELLKKGESILKPLYKFEGHARLFRTEVFVPEKYIIVEGIFAFHPELLDLYDYRIFVDVPEEIRLQRRVLRDKEDRGRSEEEVMAQYLKTVKPMHDTFVEPAKKTAHEVLSWDTYDEAALAALEKKIREEMNST